MHFGSYLGNILMAVKAYFYLFVNKLVCPTVLTFSAVIRMAVITITAIFALLFHIELTILFLLYKRMIEFAIISIFALSFNKIFTILF
jgi:hypothetical protein